jgi:hypothetical protein
MRIQGQILRASNLEERRVLKSLGVDTLRVPRRLNPFALARQVKKIAGGTGGRPPGVARGPDHARAPSGARAPRFEVRAGRWRVHSVS